MTDNAIALRNEEHLYQAPPAVPSLVPANLTEAIRLAELMAKASLVPQHLQGKPADCFLVVEQSQRWGMSPFAVAQCTSCIKGKLMWEGKLIAAVINAQGGLSRRLAYDYAGEGNERSVIVHGILRGETEPRSVTVALKDARTDNSHWRSQPDQQLAYHGARVWARRHMPELMLGVYSPEEFAEPRYEAPEPAPRRRDPQPAPPLPQPEPTQLPSAASLAERPWHQTNEGKWKAMQASVAKLNLGKAEADSRKMRGMVRENYIREVRLLYISRTIGREITSTTDLTEAEADVVIEAAKNGVFPGDGPGTQQEEDPQGVPF